MQATYLFIRMILTFNSSQVNQVQTKKLTQDGSRYQPTMT